MLCIFLVFMQMLRFFFYALDLDFYVVIRESHFSLDLFYHLEYFNVIICVMILIVVGVHNNHVPLISRSIPKV
jgi:hypothetical protein